MYFNNYIILHDLLPDKGELIGIIVTPILSDPIR